MEKVLGTKSQLDHFCDLLDHHDILSVVDFQDVQYLCFRCDRGFLEELRGGKFAAAA
jgi:hypothetical protein